MDPQYQQQQQHLPQGMNMGMTSNMYHQLLPMLQQTGQRGSINPQLYQYMNMIPGMNEMNIQQMNGMNGSGFPSSLASQLQQVENVVPSGASR